MQPSLSPPNWPRFSILLCLLLAASARADWPTHRNDPLRTGYTTNTLSTHLALRWTHQTTPPNPAWPRSARMQFDRAAQPVLAGNLLFLGGSGDHTLHALDAGTGIERWSFITGSPIRFAPACWNQRLFLGSDDGHLYCLDAATGNLIWKKRGGPDDRTILANGFLASLWPVRGGPVVRDDIVYFAAGIWPSDGIHIHALDAATGNTVWLNDEAGSIYMGQPHGGANAESGVSAQGYLVATADQLFVPTGRSVPAAFNRATGAFQYFHLQANGHQGGSDITISDRVFINSGIAFDQTSGEAAGKVNPGPVTAIPNGLVCAAETDLVGYRWIDTVQVDRKGTRSAVRGLTNSFKTSLPLPPLNTIATPQHIVAGAEDSVTLIDRESGGIVWTARVEGKALGLAVDHNRLYVSTDRGSISCFDTQSTAPDTVRSGPDLTAPGENPAFAQTARAILETSLITRGYALDLACGEGGLVLELARQSDLHIIALETDPARADTARRKLTAAGLYGTRVTVLNRPAADLPVYFANLIVSTASIGDPSISISTGHKSLRPYGGVVCLGPAGALRTTRRGPLEGAGKWTHQYSNAANTTCSEDEHLKGPLRMLWFTDVGQQMTQRHGRAPAPLFNNGILYSEGLDGIVAVDAYNGTTLWEYPLPGILKAYDGDHLMGTSGTGSNYCLSEDSLYVRAEGHCLRIDARTGRLLGKFSSPKTADGRTGVWGYIAFDEGILYGSLADPGHVVTYRYQQGGDMSRQLTESTTLFALHPETGRQLWRYDARHSIRHNSISVGAGYVALIDRPLALADRTRGAKAVDQPTGELVSLYSGTGEVLWRNTNDIYGTVTSISPGHQKIIMSYQPTAFRLASELGGRISCYDLSTGEEVWEKASAYTARPMVNGNTVYAQGGAWDLFTGEDRPFNLSRSYGCGILAGAKEMMVYRSATLGYFDLKRNQKSQDYGGLRPGCWINIIPAGGLVFAPDASAGCKCSYQNQAWIALQPAEIRPPLIDPPGGVSNKPVRVSLLPDIPASETVRYTLDGSTPTPESPAYEEPIQLAGPVTLRARSYDASGTASAIAGASFTIDEHLLPLADVDWRTVDATGAVPASAWSVSGTTVSQTANTFLNTPTTISPDPGVERPGTLRIYNNGLGFADGEFTFEINSSDDDGVGAAFRVQGDDRYYLWSMHRERNFRALTIKNGGDYRLLASNNKGYQSGTWYQVKVTLKGSTLRIAVNGEPDLEATDPTFPTGTIALHAWGNSGVQFRNLSFK